jgi:hypothetical protein
MSEELLTFYCSSRFREPAALAAKSRRFTEPARAATIDELTPPSTRHSHFGAKAL